MNKKRIFAGVLSGTLLLGGISDMVYVSAQEDFSGEAWGTEEYIQEMPEGELFETEVWEGEPVTDEAPQDIIFSEEAWEGEMEAWEEEYQEFEEYVENPEDVSAAEMEEAGSIYRRTEKRSTIEDFELLGIEEAKKDFDLPEGELPAYVSLDVPEILQKPLLPTGCEAVSLTMALRYEGFDVDKETVARDFLIYNHETDNMAIGYVGDPFSEDGAGCFPPAITATAMDFFQDQEANYAAYNITGTSMDELLAYVAAGNPVILWGTMYMAEPEFTREDAEYDGHIYYWYRQEHCVVLSGYDLENHTLQINDPLEGIVERNMEEFSRIYTKTGQNAVVLKNMDETVTEEVNVALSE